MKKILTIALVASALTPMTVYAETSAGAQTSASTQAAISGQSLNRADIVQIQQALNSQGFYRGNADGVWGPNTANAVQRFQQQNQISASGGNLDNTTLDKLGVQLSMNNSTSGNSDSTSFENRVGKRGTSVNTGADATTNSNTSTNINTSGSLNTDSTSENNNDASGGLTASTDTSAGVGASVNIGGAAGND